LEGIAPELRADALNATDSLGRLRIVLAGVEVSLHHLQAPALAERAIAFGELLLSHARGALESLLKLFDRVTPTTTTAIFRKWVFPAIIGIVAAVCWYHSLKASANDLYRSYRLYDAVTNPGRAMPP